MSAEEASANMRQAARAMRDMYVALTAEGFTEKQALVIIADTLKAAMQANQVQAEGDD